MNEHMSVSIANGDSPACSRCGKMCRGTYYYFNGWGPLCGVCHAKSCAEPWQLSPGGTTFWPGYVDQGARIRELEQESTAAMGRLAAANMRLTAMERERDSARRVARALVKILAQAELVGRDQAALNSWAPDRRQKSVAEGLVWWSLEDLSGAVAGAQRVLAEEARRG